MCYRHAKELAFLLRLVLTKNCQLWGVNNVDDKYSLMQERHAN